jgi:hypothetical protein
VSSAHDAPEQAWPFLAVLMSTPPAKDDDASGPARVRGLGFVHGDVIVTLAHIAKQADIAQLPGETMPLRVRQTAEDGALALMEPLTESSSPPRPQLTVRPLSAGEPVTVAFVSDISPSVHRVPGYGRPSEPDERFTVTLDGRLGEDETASGSPVVAGDAVVGIVSPDATSGWVSAFGAEAVRRLLATHTAGPPAPPPLSAATLRALGYALDLVPAVGPGPAVLLGVLRTGAEGEGDSVPAQLLARLNAGREHLPLEHEVDALRGDARNDPSGLTDEQIRNSPIGKIVLVAESLRVQVSDERLRRRHLLAAALGEPATAFSLPTVERTLGLPLPDLRQALREIIAGIYGLTAAWDAVLAEPAPIDLAGGVSADLVDPTTGIPLTQDHLGLGVDVTMFATLIADKKTPMPLSIGLFGEWGSGKSYFMGLLREQIRELSKSSDPRYHSKIRQIGFNAWHYADSNLWASLGDEIFEQLAGPTGTPSTEAERAALRRALEEKLQHRKELQVATKRAEAETARLTVELDKAIATRRTSAQTLATAVLKSKELKGTLTRALNRLGVPKAERIEVLAEELQQTSEDVTAVRRAVARVPRWTLAAGIVIAAAAIVAGIVASHYLAGAGAAVLTLLTTAVAIATRLRSGARLLREVADGLRRGQEAGVAEQRKALLQAETNERMLQTQLDEVIEQVGELNRELAELTPGQRLYRFVAERAASDTYRGQLGLISTIRKDFEQLSELMKDWRKDGASADQSKQAIDRIVLYIDDLDRCSPAQVVEVLQAVHLLLALDLFIVVVGVDPRWLLHSLRHEYRSMLTTPTPGAERDPRWESTPQDYLEKIFNIPFGLPRMTATSFERLVGSFVETNDPNETESETAETKPADRREEPAPDEPPAAPIAALTRETAATPAEEKSEVAAIHGGAAEPVARRPLTPEELRMLTALASLVDTPRETKRLVNLYRMMRSTRDLSPAARFLGDEATPGEYQAVVILLGLLSGHARLLHDVLVAPAGEGVRGGLRGRPSTERWAEFAAGLAPRSNENGWKNDVIGEIPVGDVEEWTRLADGLKEVSSLVTISDLKAFQLWAPRIARFSFLLSPYGNEEHH